MKLINFIKIFGALIGILVICPVEAAVPQDYAPYFKVNMDEKFPSFEKLEKDFLKQHVVYDRKYEYHWNIGNMFDTVFRVAITDYGNAEKRLRHEDEQSFLDMLAVLPPLYYQYIGPYLHTVPNIPEKILNLPGIKETKNKFPTRIAPQMADIEDLEFLSPCFYYLLMPEMWPENNLTPEKPVIRRATPKVPYNKEFYAQIKEIVPAEEFLPGAQGATKTGQSDLRTIDPDINSRLTSADIKALVRSLPRVQAIVQGLDEEVRLIHAGSFLDMWEQKQGKALAVNSLKDLVNPCQRLVQKLKIAGWERRLRVAVGSEGFNPASWAYTCDKTIKAYRMGKLHSSTVAHLKNIQDKSYIQYLSDNLGARRADIQFQTWQAIREMYTAPLEDVLEARKNRKILKQAFENVQYRILGQTIDILN